MLEDGEMDWHTATSPRSTSHGGRSCSGDGERRRFGGMRRQFEPAILQKDLQGVAASPFRVKHQWFLEQLGKIQLPWCEGHIRWVKQG